MFIQKNNIVCGDNMLIIENLSINYKSKNEISKVLENLSLNIKQGEALVILGPSGCGKSTLINALAGSIPIESGDVNFNKNNINEPLNPKKHKIGVIPQNFGLLPWKTIKENSILPLIIRHEKINDERKEQIHKIYESLDILELLHRYPRELSGGQAQRAAIARAFILQPDLLLMDEPFSALDAITREEARELFLKIWSHYKPTTILVTHSIDEALYLGNRIIVMGMNGGQFTFHMDNPYFGKLFPEEVNYLKTKQILREKLK